jgi:hypothetical protein
VKKRARDVKSYQRTRGDAKDYVTDINLTLVTDVWVL